MSLDTYFQPRIIILPHSVIGLIFIWMETLCLILYRSTIFGVPLKVSCLFLLPPPETRTVLRSNPTDLALGVVIGRQNTAIRGTDKAVLLRESIYVFFSVL